MELTAQLESGIAIYDRTSNARTSPLAGNAIMAQQRTHNSLSVASRRGPACGAIAQEHKSPYGSRSRAACEERNLCEWGG